MSARQPRQFSRAFMARDFSRGRYALPEYSSQDYHPSAIDQDQGMSDVCVSQHDGDLYDQTTVERLFEDAHSGNLSCGDNPPIREINDQKQANTSDLSWKPTLKDLHKLTNGGCSPATRGAKATQGMPEVGAVDSRIEDSNCHSHKEATACDRRVSGAETKAREVKKTHKIITNCPDDEKLYASSQSLHTKLNEDRVKSPEDLLVFSRKPREVQYQPKTLSEYRRIHSDGYYQLGKLKPDLNSDELQLKRAQAERMKEFSKNLRDINLKQKEKTKKFAPTVQTLPKERSTREKALEFARHISKPKLPKSQLSHENGEQNPDLSTQSSFMDSPRSHTESGIEPERLGSLMGKKILHATKIDKAPALDSNLKWEREHHLAQLQELEQRHFQAREAANSIKHELYPVT